MTERLTRVQLSGTLGKKFGREHMLAVHSPAQAIRALCVLVPGFERELMSSKDRGIAYAVFRDSVNIGESELCNPLGREKIRVAPILQASKSGGFFQTILGAAIVAVGAVGDVFTDGATSPLIGIGLSMMAGGVMQMLSPQQRGLATQDGADNSASYNFNGAVNTQAQGNPVPLLYGRALVGSAVASAGIYAQDQVWSSATGTTAPAADALLSTSMARIVDIISEGPVRGPANGLQSFLLSGTPLLNPDGSTNFPGCTVDYRLGTQDQDFMSGFPAVNNEIAVGVELTQVAPWTHVITNTQVTSVTVRLGVPQLESTNQTTGKIDGYRVDYAVDLSTDGAGFQQILTGAFVGQATSEYERSIVLELPKSTTGWSVRVRRITANANSALVADTTNVVAVTETIDVKLRYPMTAIVGWLIDATTGASSFQNRSHDWYGRIISVPANYDPDARTYSGVWDGTFKEAWTDNPAWIFYDLVLNDRYGLGDRISAAQVDKYGLYQIAQYCDVMVSDGKGGMEPRMTCNAYLQTQADAFKVLQDLAAIFRGIAYWASGTVACVANMPRDPVYVYTQANTVGKFNYPGSPRTSRYTVALVSWSDPSNGFKQAVEYVPDDEGIKRYGIRQTAFTVFGCTSQGQAQRAGKWALLTSRMETEGANWQVGLDGTIAMPGQVIEIADAARAGRRFAGRIAAGGANFITVDQAPTAAVGDTLTVILSTGVSEKRTISAINGNQIDVSVDWTVPPQPQAVWMVQTSDLVAQQFSVVSVGEQDGIVYELTASEYQPQKFDEIDNGTKITPRPITIVPPSVQPPPTNVRLTTNNVVDQGVVKTSMLIAWDAPDNAVAYIPEWMKDSGEWVTMPRTGSMSAQVSGIYQGAYVARVRAVNGLGVTSAPAYSVETQLEGKTSPPPLISFLRTTPLVFAVQIDWGFPAGAEDTQRTEIWYSKTNDRSTAAKLSDFTYPQATATYQGLAAGQSFFFWARLVDRSGNIGPWYPDGAGVSGQSSSDQSDYDKYFAGTVSKSALGSDVLTQINAIPGISQAVSDNAAAIAKEVNDRAAAISAEAQARGAAVTTEQTARQAADTSLGQRIDTVTAANGQTAAAIQTETTARTTADTALGQRIDTVTATANGNASAISGEITARANADSALGQRIDAVTTTTNNNTAAITAEATARTTADSALSTRVDGVFAQINPPMAGDTTSYAGSTSEYVGVWSEQSARAEADLALAQRTDTVSAQLQSAAAALNAAIQVESEARATADSAQASLITTVQATANENAAAVQTVAQSYADLNGRVAASYQIKTQVTANGRTYIAGIGVGVDNNSGEIESQVLLSASRVAVIDPNGTAVTAPFVVQGGQVFMSQALIGVGWITSLMIDDTIQSTAVGANGQPRWKLDKNGTITLNGVNGGIGHLTVDDSAIRYYDGNGTLRCAFGGDI